MMVRKTLPALVLLLLGGFTQLAAQSEEDRLYNLAVGYEGGGNLEDAARVYEELHKLDPDSRVYFDGLRRTMTLLRRFEDLLPYVEGRVDRYPGDVEARIAYAELLNFAGKSTDAVRQWEKATELRPNDLTTYLFVAESATNAGRMELAVDLYLRARAATGENPVITERLAQLYALDGKYDLAAREYLNLLDSSPRQISYVKGALGAIAVSPEGAAAAARVIEEEIADRRDNEVLLDLLSWIYLESGDVDRAFDVIIRLDRERKSKGSAVYAFLDRTVREGRWDAAIVAAEYFMKEYDRENPLYPSTLYSYVQALQGKSEETGAFDRAQAEELIAKYKEVMASSPGGSIAAQGLQQIATLQAEVLDDPEGALRSLEETFGDRSATPDPEALLLAGDLNLRLGRMEEARAFYDQIVAPRQMSVGIGKVMEKARLRQAEMLFFEKKFAEAVEEFTALTKDVSSDAANDALDYLFLLNDHVDVYDAGLAAYAEGKYSERKREHDDVVAAMDRAIELAPDAPLVDDALVAKGTALRALRKFEEAREAFLSALEEKGDETMADRGLFLAAEVSERDLQQMDRALELYTKLLADFPSSQYASQARERIRKIRKS